MIVLVDNGHGFDTKGKQSPDGRLFEWKYCREIADELCKAIIAKGYQAQRIVTEDYDVRLQERCRRVNAVCDAFGTKNVLLVSIHNNAAGNGGWKNATGWSGWVYTKASQRSRLLAQYLYKAAEQRGLKGNRSVPPTKYWEANFYILKNTHCPAVLTENLFQDNKGEVDYLLSDEGRKAIVDLHVDGIINYINSQS